MLFAAAAELDIGAFLFDVLAVLLAAKLAAELAERVGIPAVLGEIVAGIVIGPSLLGLVESSEVLFMLGEIGVILLLFQVGMEMDLGELGKVGKASLLVAVTGVAVPFAVGALGGLALGESANAAVFLGAALTATSVGITARVFGDLRALSTIESRIVLGAAVADDVLGLVILTVVARVVIDGSVSAGLIIETIALALGFLALTGIVGIAVMPALLGAVQRISRSTSTLTAVTFAVMIGFATLADVAKLAPIIGAFMAGLAIGRTPQAQRIEHEFSSIGHIFVPVFFLQIGIDTDITSLVKPDVLAVAGVLTVIAVAGKIVAAVGARGTRADLLLVGIGMVPRGEVGLIFATIGLRTGVLDDELYAALVLVVLLTTVLTPPLIRKRFERVEALGDPDRPPPTERPAYGWLGTDDGLIVLDGRPPPADALTLALETARLARHARPSERLLDWLEAHRADELVWDADATAELFTLLRHGDARSWRLLDALGVLDRALPELAGALAARKRDPKELDPVRTFRWPLIDRLHELADDVAGDARFVAEHARLEHPDWLALAVLLLDVGGGDPAVARPIAERLLGRLALPPEAEQEVALLVGESGLLRAAARDPDSYDRQAILELATHLGSVERARASFLLAVVAGDLQPWQHKGLEELHDMVVEALTRQSSTDGETATIADAHRRAAQALVTEPGAQRRLHSAPRSFILTHEPDELARQSRLVEPVPQARDVRVAVTPNGVPGRWKIDIACRDRPGLLAHLTRGLTEAGLDIAAASVATWADGAVLDSFTVTSADRPSARALADRLERSVASPVTRRPLTDVDLQFDNASLPWHTALVVTGPDRPGLLHAVAAALGDAELVVHSARIGQGADGSVHDRFAISDRRGRKLTGAQMALLEQTMASGRVSRRQRWLAHR